MTTHDWYVASAYGAALIGLGGLILILMLNQRSLRRQTAELDAAGVKRRSQRETKA